MLYRPEHSLINQSLRARMGVEATNDDGFGIGWYSADGDGTPAVFRDTAPAWNNRNLRQLAAHVRSPLFFAHVRASIDGLGRTADQLPPVPSRDAQEERRIDGHAQVPLQPVEVRNGSVVPPSAARRAGAAPDDGGGQRRAAGLDLPILQSGASRSLFHSSRAETVRHSHPDLGYLHEISDDTRIMVSEPLGDLPGMWNELPEASCAVIPSGPEPDYLPFLPEPG